VIVCDGLRIFSFLFSSNMGFSVPMPAHPEEVVANIAGTLLPTITLPTKPKSMKRRIRSFGVLEEAEVPSDGYVDVVTLHCLKLSLYVCTILYAR
jgi:hypothetical protein